MINENFIYLGAFIFSIGSISYIIDTFKGKAKPNRVTFLLWAIAPLIAFFSEISQGVGLQSLLPFIVGFFPILIFLASFINKKAEWKITMTKIGNIAIIFSIMADGLAALPTLKKSYYYPETENAWIYITGAIYAGITLLTIKTWNFPHYGFTIYLLLANIILTCLIQFNFKKVFQKTL